MKKMIVIICMLLYATLAHGFNMFSYPYFENDEGTYTSQAYAVAYENKVTNYTYWYDHAPFGWIITAGWQKITNGPFAFGYSLNSGRVLMLIFHIFSSLFIYYIVKKLTGRQWPAVLAVIIFSSSPLAIYFQRRLLLDNIMTNFLLMSMTLLLYGKNKLLWIIGAGVAFVLSVLSKETAVFALPGMLFLVYLSLHPRQRMIGLVSFLTPIALGIAYYILYAALKNELLPGAGHVSLIGTWKYQLSRGGGLSFWNYNSDFASSFRDWLGKDSLFTIFGFASIPAILLFRKISWEIRSISVIGICLLFFFLRGGTIINFYVIPLLALFSITIPLVLWKLQEKNKFFIIPFILIALIWILISSKKPWTNDEVSPQIASVDWIKKHINPKATLAVDNAQLIDLQLSRFNGDPTFTNAHYFWKLDKDPQVREDVIKDDWRNINYTVLTHEFLTQARENSVPHVSDAINYSQFITGWGPVSNETYLNVPRKISTNGDWVYVYKTMDATDISLLNSWNVYRKNFISYEGQVIDPQSDSTTSEGQSYAMIRSMQAADKDSFDLVWTWTKNHLQFRSDDKLLSWKWAPAKKGHVADSGFATDADIDTATALILASKKWNSDIYLTDAKTMINDIWNQAIVQGGDNRYYVLPGSWAGFNDNITVNPSYLSPAVFRLFAKVDPVHPWDQVATDSYVFLNKVSSLSSTHLPPDWVGVVKSTGELTPLTQPNLSKDFGYDAMRVYYRVAQDYLWFGTSAAKQYLQNNTFLVDYFSTHGNFPAGFSLSGTPTVTYESYAFYGSALPFFKIVNPQAYDALKILMATHFQNGLWESSDNYYTQNWAWLGTSLAEGKYVYEK